MLTLLSPWKIYYYIITFLTKLVTILYDIRVYFTIGLFKNRQNPTSSLTVLSPLELFSKNSFFLTTAQGISLHFCLSISFMVELVCNSVDGNFAIFKNVFFSLLRLSFLSVSDCILSFHFFILPSISCYVVFYWIVFFEGI